MRIAPVLLSLVIVATSLAEVPFKYPSYLSQTITPNSDTTIDSINNINGRIRSSIDLLVNKSYFKYFKLNLYKECPFWNSNHFCVNENCAVDILDWSKVEDSMKPSKLGSIMGNKTLCETLNYCKIEDKDEECVWVSLPQNPERFTGYGGEQSSQIWSAIYNENCFSFENCTESNFFYKLISGLHASIGVHLSNEYIDFVTGNFQPNLKIFMERVGNFNERILNIYFNYALLAQSIVKINSKHQLNNLISNATHFGELNDSVETNFLINDITSNLPTEIFDTSTIFQDELLKNEFRSKFRNVSQIMDCVGCDRCRMWGKIQILGYGTALKILFEDLDEIEFSNFEIIALYNTFDRLSKSVESINNFIHLYEIGGDDELNTLMRDNLPFLASQNLQSADEHSRKPQKLPTNLGKKKSIAQPKIPKKPKRETPMTLKEELYDAYNEVYRTLIFVLKSYYQFPRLLLNIITLQLNFYWNKFIGRENHYDYKSHYESLFTLVDL